MTTSGTASKLPRAPRGISSGASYGSISQRPVVNTQPGRRGAALGLGIYVAALLIAYVALFMDRTLAQYVDESDNLLGGLMIARGYRLYADFFSQHMPVPYLVAALGTRLGIGDLVGYRVFFSVLVLLFFGYLYLQFRRQLSPVFLVVLVLTFGVGHPMFSGEMLLADHFFGLALLLLLLFVLARDVDFSIPEQIAISLCCFAAVQSTLISVYPLLWLGAYYIVRKAARHVRGGQPSRWRREAAFFAILLVPHVLLLAWLLARGEAGPLVDQAIRFNQTYYAPYDLGGSPTGILVKSLSDFKEVVVQYLRPPSIREVETFLLVSNIAAVVVVWLRRDALFAAFYVGLVLLSRMRGAGYHGSPYFLVSFASTALVLAFAAEQAISIARRRSDQARRERLSQVFRFGRAVATLALVAYLGLAALFYHDIAGFYLHLPRGVGDAQDVQTAYAAIVDAVTTPGDRIWAAPFEPYVYLKSARLPASAYWYYHPWMSDSPEVTDGVLRDLQAARPLLIVFEADKQIPWDFPLPTPRDYGARVYGVIQAGYLALDPQDPVLRNVFVLNDRVDSVRADLEQRGLIRPPNAAVADPPRPE